MIVRSKTHRRDMVALQNYTNFATHVGMGRNSKGHMPHAIRRFQESVKNMPDIVLQMVEVATDYGLVPFYVTDDGGDYEEVEEAWKNRNPIPIWTGASEGTIWGSEIANWFFRTWHDSIHCKESCGFGLEGEIEAAVHHMKQATAKGYHHLAAVCWVEIVGQATVFHKTGDFPPQSFTRDTLNDMGLNEVGAM